MSLEEPFLHLLDSGTSLVSTISTGGSIVGLIRFVGFVRFVWLVGLVRFVRFVRLVGFVWLKESISKTSKHSDTGEEIETISYGQEVLIESYC